MTREGFFDRGQRPLDEADGEQAGDDHHGCIRRDAPQFIGDVQRADGDGDKERGDRHGKPRPQADGDQLGSAAYLVKQADGDADTGHHDHDVFNAEVEAEEDEQADESTHRKRESLVVDNDQKR